MTGIKMWRLATRRAVKWGESGRGQIPAPLAKSAGLDVDPLDARLGLLGLGQGHGQHAALELRLGLFGVHARQPGSSGGSCAGLRGEAILLGLLLALAADRKHVVGDVHLDILVVEAGQIDRDQHRLVGFRDVGARPMVAMLPNGLSNRLQKSSNTRLRSRWSDIKGLSSSLRRPDGWLRSRPRERDR